MRLFPISIFALLFCALLYGADADRILKNGKVVTVDSRFSIAEALAIRGNRIVSVGTTAAIESAERGAGTKIIDPKGKMVLPGLVDSHVHAYDAGVSEFRAPLPPLNSVAAIRAYIEAQAAKTPKGEWIVVPRRRRTEIGSSGR